MSKLKSLNLTLLGICTLFLFLGINDGRCQKEGNNWPQGNPLNGGGISFNFNPEVLNLEPFPIGIEIGNCSSAISDSSGNILFYTNGVQIANRENQIMPNGLIAGFSGFSYMDLLEFEIDLSTLLLKQPGNDSIYYIFKQDLDENSSCSDAFGFGIINKNKDNGLGDVVSKENLLLSFPDSTLPQVFAVKHANGRDWWIIKLGVTNYIYTFLLSNNGIDFIEKQSITKDSTYNIIYSLGQGFSPNGEYFVLQSWYPINPNQSFNELLNFDRCTGKFTYNQRFYTTNFSSNVSYPGSSVEFSPNSKLIYLATSGYLFQFKTESEIISTTIDTIGLYDGIQDSLGFSLDFYNLKLGPNNKIYITPGSTYFIHEIENPDVVGIGCSFVQRKYTTQHNLSFRLPHLPNYKLGPIDGSVCDSLGIDNPIAVEEQKPEPNFSIYPNPAKGHFFVRSEQNQPCQIQVINALGQLALKAELKQGKGSVKVNIPPGLQGLFVVEIYQNNQIKLRGKLVVEGE